MATINLGAIKFNWKGAYNSGTSYAVDDVVSSSGNSYVCIQAHSNQAVGDATAYWNIMSKAGTNGSAGDTFGLANNEIAFKTNAGALDGIGIGTAGQSLKVNSGANGYEFGTVGGGKVLQVLQSVKTDTFSANVTSFQNVTGLSQTITPSATSSKILAMVNLQIGSITGAQCQFNLLRGSTSIGMGDARGSRTRAFAEQDSPGTNGQDNVAMMNLDSPSTTSARNYQVQMRVTGGTHYLNRSSADGDANYESTTSSSITLMEIGA